jgi:hypothetical protein
MSTKSIVEIDVQDEAFKRFGDLFEKYAEVLAGTPATWKSVGKESTAVAKQFERMVAALLAQNQLSRESKDADEKRHKQLVSTEKLWTSMARSSGTIAKNVLDIGAGMLKWGSLIAGGLVGGGLFGIDKMAASVSNSRRSAMGLGMSIGEQKSFNINFERLLDPNFLSQVAEMKMDPSKAGPLYTMGVGTGGSTEQTAVALVKAMRTRALATPVGMLGMLDSMTGLNAGAEEWRRLHDMPGSEFNSLIAGNRRDIAGLNIDPATARKWTEFTKQMELAGGTIFKVFVTGLAPLAEPLTHLSKSLTEFVARLFPAGGNGPVQKGIEGLGHWLDGLSGKLSAPEFLSSVDKFVSSTGKIADSLHDLSEDFDSLRIMAGGVGAAGGAVKNSWIQGWHFWTDPIANAWHSLNNNGAPDADYFKSLAKGYANKNGSSYALAVAEMGLESSYGANTGTQPGGATGLFQIKPVWSKYFGENPDDPKQATDMATKINAILGKKYGSDFRAQLAAFHMGETDFDKVYKFHRKDWINYVDTVRPGTSNYVNQGMRIIVNNNTGGSAHVSVNALAAGP